MSAWHDGPSLTCARLTLLQFHLEIGHKQFPGGSCQREGGKGRGAFSSTGHQGCRYGSGS